MTGTIILISAPLITGIGGFFAEKYGKKFLSCALCGIMAFLVLAFRHDGGEYNDLVADYSIFSAVPYTNLADYSFSPIGYKWLIKLASLLIPDADGFVMLIAAFNAVGISLFLYRRCSTAYIGAAVYMFCFLPAVLWGMSTYIAALITLFSFRYIEEQRFFRFAGLTLLAACFDITALLIIPIFFITLIKNTYITAVISAALSAAMVFLPEAADSVFGFIGTGSTLYLPLPAAIIAAASALICVLISKMLAAQKKTHISTINGMLVGAAFAAASVSDGRFFPVSLFLLMPAAVTLAPEAVRIVKIIILKTFREKSGIAAAAAVIGALILLGMGVYLNAADIFGTSTYTLSL